MAPDDGALRPGRTTRLHDVDLAPRAVDPDPEPGQVAVPVERFPVPGGQRPVVRAGFPSWYEACPCRVHRLAYLSQHPSYPLRRVTCRIQQPLNPAPADYQRPANSQGLHLQPVMLQWPDTPGRARSMRLECPGGLPQSRFLS